MGDYFDELKKSMQFLAQDIRVIFVGQTVGYKGTAFFKTLEGISETQRLELPVFEDVQMGMTIGLSFEGYIPVSFFPRMDFMVLGFNQLVNHLDKMEEMSSGQFKPKIIIRTAIGSVKPLFPGPQHCQDHVDALKLMLKNVDVIKLTRKEDVFPAYQKALTSEKSTIIVELPDLYHADSSEEFSGIPGSKP
ncbi:hypothetical protein FJZ18_04155 [Candidatus Pacearchaeota archaeon]|nr:hypothetical protein [Candidatus Pacearchaeota archaeon]